MYPSIIGVTSAEAATASIPTGHHVGDILIGFAFRDGSVTNPTVPSPWTTLINTLDGTTCSASIAWKPCLSAAESSGTWTNATGLLIVCLRNVDLASPILTRADSTGTTNTITYAALTDANLRGAIGAKILAIIAHRSTDVTIETAPALSTNIHKLEGATNDMAAFEMTADDAWASTTAAISGTASGWISTVIAVRGAPVAIRNDSYRGITAGTGNTGIVSVSREWR